MWPPGWRMRDWPWSVLKAGWSVGNAPYYACVPTKMMIRAADALAEARRVGELAGSAQVRPDWTPVDERIRAEATADWDDTIAVQRFEKTGKRFVRGWGRITALGEVTVTTSDGERVFRAVRGIVLNPGTEPAVPPIAGLRVRPGLCPLRRPRHPAGDPTAAAARR